MKFAIRWSRPALDALTQLWLDHPDQRADITQAAATIDQLLQLNPAEQGESREDDRRILFVSPLVVIFNVNAEKGLVRVLNVRQFKRRGS